MDDDDEARRARAAARASWPMRRIPLAEEGNEPLATEQSPGELVASVWRLSRDAWASSGQPLPTYSRSEMPGRMVRRPPKDQ